MNFLGAEFSRAVFKAGSTTSSYELSVLEPPWFVLTISSARLAMIAIEPVRSVVWLVIQNVLYPTLRAMDRRSGVFSNCPGFLRVAGPMII